MGAYTKLRERRSGEVQYSWKWGQIWEEAKSAGELAKRGWPDSWEEFRLRRLVVCDENAPLGPKPRKRRPGGGRKPDPDKMRIRQICLSRAQVEAVKQMAQAAGLSQSAWIREAVAERLAKSCTILEVNFSI